MRNDLLNNLAMLVLLVSHDYVVAHDAHAAPLRAARWEVAELTQLASQPLQDDQRDDQRSGRHGDVGARPRNQPEQRAEVLQSSRRLQESQCPPGRYLPSGLEGSNFGAACTDCSAGY